MTLSRIALTATSFGLAALSVLLLVNATGSIQNTALVGLGGALASLLALAYSPRPAQVRASRYAGAGRQSRPIDAIRAYHGL
jgi:hypothetical protein